MSNMTLTSPRATYDELLEFANRVREAGGGNPLDALMPSVPGSATQCLIAKNLNFNCEVHHAEYIANEETDDFNVWCMFVDSEQLADRIASGLGLTKVWDGPSKEDIEDDPDLEGEGEWAVRLPVEIGQVAHDFDNYREAIRSHWDAHTRTYSYSIKSNATSEQIDNLRSFWPYIEASEREAITNATFINEKGELVL